MKNIFALLCVAFAALSCSQKEPQIEVTITNPLAMDRVDEIVEISMESVTTKLQLSDGATVVVIDNATQAELPSQVTYDGKLLFQATAKAKGTATYTIKVGTPAEAAPKVFGRQFPERVDDIAWENDRIAFRLYGPALQASNERAFGYDVWVKSVPELVVNDRYAKELDPAMKEKIAELRKTDPQAAKDLYNSISYHVDHGNGLDCYKVGPTLGAGTAALVENKEIIYPYCYNDFEIVDEGPLRFTVKLVYNPITVKGQDNVIEHRTLTLDAGSQLNKIAVSYENLTLSTPIVSGIVMHEQEGDAIYTISEDAGFATYATIYDEATGWGTTYVGTVFTDPITEGKAVYFSEEESKNERIGTTGHVSLFANYIPKTEFTYYCGAGWSKFGFDSYEAWVEYVDTFSQKVASPLKVATK